MARVVLSEGDHGIASDYLSQKWLINPEVSKDYCASHHSTRNQEDPTPVLIMWIQNKLLSAEVQ